MPASVSIDIRKAQGLPGVKAVVTGKNFPPQDGALPKGSHPSYAVDKVR